MFRTDGRLLHEEAFESVRPARVIDRQRIQISPDLLDGQEVEARHLEEPVNKCAISRDRAMNVTSWNVAQGDYPIDVVEFNWLDGGEWVRAYGDFEDGYHRAERAILEHLPKIWIRVSEHRFLPKGGRPADRVSLE
jgi:Fe-S-cluster formation regulator IscX/YfhJ